MKITQLVPRWVEKPWGRRDLLPCFGKVPGSQDPVGEIWFEDPASHDRQLLVKYLFTSEKLSIQVHPDDGHARASGYSRGKDEAWVVLAADEDAVIGIGLRHATSRDLLRESAINGHIVDLVEWRPAVAGDVYYSPAGTIHALGQGLTVIEIQQNVDLTYRLYDYGRPRELHLDDGISVANPEPYKTDYQPHQPAEGRLVLAEGPAFVLERWRGVKSGRMEASDELPLWLIPIAGEGEIDGKKLDAGSVWLLDGPAEINLHAGSDALVAYTGSKWNVDLLT